MYGVTILARDNTELVHCARSIRYNDSLLGKDVHQEVLDLADQTETQYEIVDEIVYIGRLPIVCSFKLNGTGYLMNFTTLRHRLMIFMLTFLTRSSNFWTRLTGTK